MGSLTQVVVLGAGLGAVYSLIALAFNITYRVTGALNFSVGHLVMFGAFIATSAVQIVGGHSWGVLLALPAMAALGGVLGAGVFLPLRRRSLLWFIVATLAVSIGLENLAIVIWGPEPRTLPLLVNIPTLNVNGVPLAGGYLAAFVTVAIALALLAWILFKTRSGIRLRAAGEDADMARLVGINSNRTAIGSFCAAGALSGLAGTLIGPLSLVTPDMGGRLILFGFVAIVIGGFGNLFGSILGGLAVGMLDVLLAQILDSSQRAILLFTLLIVFLVFRPSGILGEAAGRRV